MKTIQINIYTLDELVPEAREYAIQRFIDINVRHEWYEYEYHDFIAICKTIGLTVEYSGIVFSAFNSQDSASVFAAGVDLIALLDGVLARSWKSYAPKLKLQITPPQVDRRVIALLRNGNIAPSIRIFYSNKRPFIRAVIEPNLDYHIKPYSRITGELVRLEDWVQGVADCLNRHLFKSLEREYDFQTGAEAIADTITANGYHFTKDGSFAGNIELLIENTGEQHEN